MSKKKRQKAKIAPDDDIQQTAADVASTSSGVTSAESEHRSPLAPFIDFDREFERAFERFFRGRWLGAPKWEFPRPFGEKSPDVNLIDRENEIVIEAELPGVSKEDLDVSVSEKTVTIKASTRREEEKEEGDYHRREISTGLYSRTLSLPAAVEGENAKAEFKDGVLRLTLPKSEQSRRISIQVD